MVDVEEPTIDGRIRMTMVEAHVIFFIEIYIVKQRAPCSENSKSTKQTKQLPKKRVVEE